MNLKKFQYIGPAGARRLIRKSVSINLENVTDERVAALLKQDSYWNNHFEKVEKPAPKKEDKPESGKK